MSRAIVCTCDTNPYGYRMLGSDPFCPHHYAETGSGVLSAPQPPTPTGIPEEMRDKIAQRSKAAIPEPECSCPAGVLGVKMHHPSCSFYRPWRIST